MTARSPLGPHCLGSRVVVRRVLGGATGPSGGPALTDVLGVMVEWTSTTTTIRTEDGSLVRIARADIVSGKPVPPRRSMRQRVSATDAELRANDSWPPLVAEPLGSWLLRASAGFSARANSVLAVGAPDRPWPEAVAEVRQFYAGLGLPAWAEVVVGSDEQAQFGKDGWQPLRPGEADSAFQLAGVAGALRAARSLSSTSATAAPVTVELATKATDHWLANDSRSLAHRQAAIAVLEGPPQVTFASVLSQGRIVAKGRAALSERADVWLGLTDLWVDPAHRRGGLATVVLAELLAWGAECGATTAYLQVRGDNDAALAAYRRLGFETHHTYRYLSAPAQ